MIDLEIVITRQVIAEEPQTQLKGEQANGLIEIVIVGVDQKGPGLADVALEDGFTQLQIKVHRAPVGRFFAEAVAAGAQAVADVVVHQARLDRVEIHQGNRLAGGEIKHDVIELGITVNRPQLQPTGRLGVLEHEGEALAIADEGDAVGRLGGERHGGGAQGPLELGQIARGDVEALQGVGELGHRQLTDQGMEDAQPPPQLPGLGAILEPFTGAATRHKGEGAPDLTLQLQPTATGLIAQGNGAGHLPATPRQHGGGRPLHMLRQPQDVGHHQLGLGEHLRVETLQHQLIDLTIRGAQAHPVGVVDIALTQRADGDDRTRQREGLGDRQQRIGRLALSGAGGSSEGGSGQRASTGRRASIGLSHGPSGEDGHTVPRRSDRAQAKADSPSAGQLDGWQLGCCWPANQLARAQSCRPQSARIWARGSAARLK